MTCRIAGESASQAEMRFAGQYLNLFGVLLLVVGVLSYLKTSGASNGQLESFLGGALGLVFLVAGEYFYRRGLSHFSHPVITGGFCLLYFTLCWAHFRYGLLSSETLFFCLLPIVVGSNGSVFRYNSKLTGHLMLVVYLFAPVLLTFNFKDFTAVFCYLLAINLGAALVAFFKKWDFQLLASSLGSYTLYFFYFHHEEAVNSLVLLLAIYSLNFAAGNLVYFLRSSESPHQLLVSLVNPVIFAVLSTLVAVGLPNWVRVALFALLAFAHGYVAVEADKRRAHNPSLQSLATCSLVLTLLFLSVSVSFVTYLSDSTSYFGLVTLLWFILAIGTLIGAYEVRRHFVVLSRFSYFTLALAAVQVMFVLPTMKSALTLQLLSLLIYGFYFLLFQARVEANSGEASLVFQFVGVLGAALAAVIILPSATPLAASLVFLLLAAATLPLQGSDSEPGLLTFVPYFFTAVAFWSSVWISDGIGSRWFLLPLGLALFSLALHRGIERGTATGFHWVWVALFLGRLVFFKPPSSLSETVLSLAFFHLLLQLYGSFLKEGLILARCSGVVSLGVAVGAFGLGEGRLAILFGALVLLGLSHLVAVCSHGPLPMAESGVHTILVVLLLGRAFTPYPMWCLTGAVGMIIYLAHFRRLSEAAGLSFLLSVGVLTLPLQGRDDWGYCGLLLLTPAMAAVLAKTVHEWGESRATDGMMFSLLFVGGKFSLMVDPGSFSSFCWALGATVLLGICRTRKAELRWNEVGQGLFDFSRILFMCCFVKVVVWDSNLSGELDVRHYLFAMAVCILFFFSAHVLIKEPQARNALVVLGLLMACFQVTLALHSRWGHSLLFQPALSGFWSVVSIFIVALGIYRQVRIYRLFGLATLVGNTAKILLVDISVLDAYTRTNTFLILGTLLMLTSSLYQRQRERLCPSPV